MGAAVWWLDRTLAAFLSAGAASDALRTVIGAAVGVTLYLPIAARLGVAEVGWVVRIVRGKLGI